MIDPDGEEWVPSIEAARRLGIDPHDIRNWVARGRIRSERISGRRWVNYQDCAACERRGRAYRKGSERGP